MIPAFPRALLRERSHSWNLAGVASAGNAAAQSFAPIVRSDGGGFWVCSMQDISLSGGPGLRGRDRQRISTLLWRAVRQICDGGVNPIVVPRSDALFRPWPDGLSHRSGLDLPHGDGALFSDGDGYYQAMIDVICGPAPLRATALGIRINAGGQLMGGESFSIEHPTAGWRMYEISRVDDDAGVIYFSPPLREAVANNTQLEFDRPRCVMRLMSPGSMDLSVVPWTFNTASVQFVEAPAV